MMLGFQDIMLGFQGVMLVLRYHVMLSIIDNRQTQFDFTVKESLSEPTLEYIQEVVVGNTHTYVS